MLNSIRCFLLDLDGTIYLGKKLLPGVKEFLNLLEERSIKHLFLTNNSSKHTEQYVKKLAGFGLQVEEREILTSGEATARYIKRTYGDGRVYLVGTPELEKGFQKFGIQLDDKKPSAVVLGFDTTLTYEKLRKICDFIRDGIPYVATHPDINCPTETGFIPDIGSFIALIKSSTGREPDVIIGKPYENMMNAVLERTGYQKEEIAMVGDRLYTDMAMGKAGIRTILVLSGETKRNDLIGAGIKPDFVVSNLKDLVRKMT